MVQLARRILPRPTPTPAGDKPPRYIFSRPTPTPAGDKPLPPSAIGLQIGTFRRRRAGIEVDWRAHPGSESGTCFRTNDEWGRGSDEGGRMVGFAGWLARPWLGTSPSATFFSVHGGTYQLRTFTERESPRCRLAGKSGVPGVTKSPRYSLAVTEPLPTAHP